MRGLPVDSPDVIKIDIEGGEWEVLGDVDTLNARVVGVEVHPWLLPDSIDTEAVINRLGDFGYEVRPTDDLDRADHLIAERSV